MPVTVIPKIKSRILVQKKNFDDFPKAFKYRIAGNTDRSMGVQQSPNVKKIVPKIVCELDKVTETSCNAIPKKIQICIERSALPKTVFNITNLAAFRYNGTERRSTNEYTTQQIVNSQLVE